jgi:hypothetical protein
MKYQFQIKKIAITSFFILTILLQIIFNSIQNNIDSFCPESRSFIVEFISNDGYENFIIPSSTKTNSNKISSSFDEKIKRDIKEVYRQNEIIFSSLINEYLVIEDQNSLLRTIYSSNILLRSPPTNLS